MQAFVRRRTVTAITLAGALMLPLFAATSASAATPLVQASLGDSISKGVSVGGKNASGGGIDNAAANWSTGTDSRVKSHLQSLREDAGQAVTGTNYAVGGTTSSAIAGQASKLLASTAYVTILTGGNDICNSSSLAALPSKTVFKANVEKGLTTIAKTAPDAEVLLASVPNVPRLYEIAKTDAAGAAVHRSNKVCAIALGTSPSETASQAASRRASVDTRIREYNAALSELAAKYVQVAYDQGASYNTSYTLADLSTADYFHPSYSGQAKLAANTWRAAESQGVVAAILSGGGSSPTPTASPTPENPTAQVSVNILGPTTAPRGDFRIKAAVTSNDTIASVTASVAGSSTAIPLGKNAADGYYYSNLLDPESFGGATSFTVKAVTKTGAVATDSQSISR